MTGRREAAVLWLVGAVAVLVSAAAFVAWGQDGALLILDAVAAYCL